MVIYNMLKGVIGVAVDRNLSDNITLRCGRPIMDWEIQPTVLGIFRC
jgi:hypothetical protein